MNILLVFFFITFMPLYAQFSNESELSLIQAGGNSELQTNNFKTVNKYVWGLNTLGLGAHYTYGETENSVSARNWDLNSRYERELHPKFSFILGEVIEGNRFVGLKVRYNTDIGLKYFLIKTDELRYFSELTYRYSIEDRYRPIMNSYDNKGRIYKEWEHKLSKTVQYRLWLEYIPNFTESNDYLINGEASITSILNSIFSLKVSYKGMYDNKQAFSGFKNYDYMTTTSIVAKF